MVITTKYNIGDKIWFIHERKAHEKTIIYIDTEQRKTPLKISYWVNMEEDVKKDSTKYEIITEDNVFSSKEELIDSL